MSASEHTKPTAKMPFPEFILAGAGAFPLTTLASMIVMGIKFPGVDSTFALMTYGAVVLGFLGAVHWGLAMVTAGDYVGSAWGAPTQWRRYMLSMVPGLVGWVALLLPLKAGAWVMIAGFCLLALYDWWSLRAGEGVPWLVKLRFPVAVAAAGSLLVGIAIRT